MPNKVLALLLAVFCISHAKAVDHAIVDTDSNINIVSAMSTFTFYKDKQTGKVIINETTHTRYKNSQPTTLPITEFYNSQSKIVALSCRLNNKSVSDFKPVDTYYSSKDIFHSDERINYFPLAMPANSVADVTVEKNTLDPIYFNAVYFSEQYFTANREVLIKIPRWMNVSMKEVNFKSFEITKSVVYNIKDDTDYITYKCTNLPAFKTENYSPGQSYIYPHLLALANPDNKTAASIYFRTTQEQYNWYRSLTEDLKADQNPDIEQQAKLITAGKSSDLDKLKAIYYWVQDNIRYIAFEDGIAGFKPDLATEVLRKKYGDCKGMANLTKNLLQSLGYDARLCWLGTNHIAYNYYTPSLAVDNHMICAVIYNGKTYFLDTTETFLGFGEYAERIQGRQVLMENGQQYILSNVPVTAVEMNGDVVKKTLTIQDRNLVGKVSHLWRGEDKEYLLSNLNSNKKDKFDHSFQRLLENGNQNYQISNLTYSPMNLYDSDITASYQLNFKNSVDIFDKSCFLSLDSDKEYENFDIDTTKRSHDVWLPFKTSINKEVELTLPINYMVSDKPGNLTIKNDHYLFEISYEDMVDKLIYRKKIIIYDTRIPREMFKMWNSDIKKLTQKYSETLTLKPKK